MSHELDKTELREFMTNAITEQELTEARQIWGDALVAISKAFDTDGIESARAVANGAIDAAYGYNLGPVLFKPTMASGEQTFRPYKGRRPGLLRRSRQWLSS